MAEMAGAKVVRDDGVRFKRLVFPDDSVLCIRCVWYNRNLSLNVWAVSDLMGYSWIALESVKEEPHELLD